MLDTGWESREDEFHAVKMESEWISLMPGFQTGQQCGNKLHTGLRENSYFIKHASDCLQKGEKSLNITTFIYLFLQ